MKVQNLTVEGKSKVVALVCGQCNIVHPLKEPERAEQCCKPTLCKDCGKEVDRSHYTTCRTCERLTTEKKEQAAFDKAKKVKFSDYAGEYLHSDSFSGEGYIATSDMEDQMEEEGMPQYAWACEELTLPTLDADRVLEDVLCDFSEDAIEQVDIKGLQTVLDEWHGKQTLINYCPTDTVVLLDELRRG